jgi:hypothetical protein
MLDAEGVGSLGREEMRLETGATDDGRTGSAGRRGASPLVDGFETNGAIRHRKELGRDWKETEKERKETERNGKGTAWEASDTWTPRFNF